MATQQLPQGEQENVSAFQSNLPLEAKLERARTELLDLGARNRLLNMPRSAKSAKSIDIVDEQSREIFRLLVRDQRPFTFHLAGKRRTRTRRRATSSSNWLSPTTRG